MLYQNDSPYLFDSSKFAREFDFAGTAYADGIHATASSFRRGPTFASASDLANAFRRAEAAHGEHEKRTGQRDANWADWYAAYMVAEQAGGKLPL